MIELFTVLTAVAVLASAQDPVPAPQDAPAQLEDVQVTARQTADLARTFVGRVAAPARGRGLGRWRKVCPGVANLDRAIAQPIVDRIAATTNELGIEVEGPGCEANIIVVFTVDAAAVTRAMVEADPRVFRGQGGGIDRGGVALRAFLASDRPVRWWSLSVPIDSETGRRAVRIPGDPGGMPVDAQTAAAIGCNPNDCLAAATPVIQSRSASRINSQIVDQLYKSIIVVDIDAVSGLSTTQLGDYLSLVALSQVDPEADTAAFDTVLNLFENPQGVPGLTAWDRSYLSALYGSPSRRRTVGGQANAVASIMNRTATTEPNE